MMLNKKIIVGAGLSGLLMMGSVQAEEGLKGGLGLGIPYGLLGGNLEYSLSDYTALSGGVGITPGGVGWSVGARVYAPAIGKVRPRLSAYHGVVAVLETSYWYGESDYENLTGEAFGVGLEWKMPSGDFLALDILGTNVDIPVDAVEKGSSVKLSIGYITKF